MLHDFPTAVSARTSVRSLPPGTVPVSPEGEAVAAEKHGDDTLFLGALPPMGSNMLVPSGLRLPPGHWWVP